MSDPIEIYEWEEGQPRPGSPGHKMSRYCIDTLAVPSEGQIPQVGDFLWFMSPTTKDLVRYRVLMREFLWVSPPDDKSPQKWGKMWLFVRQDDD